jgi:outer membrane lipoprotein carrier protein
MSILSAFAVTFALAGPAAPAPAATPAPAAAPARLELKTVIEKMQKNYDQAKDFRAHFTQKYTNLAFNRTKVSSGEVAFKKGGRMRWDYSKPDPQLFVSDGKVLWLYEPADKQAFKQDLKQSQLPAALSFLLGKGKLTDEFEISAAGEVPYGAKTDYRLSLKPKKPQATYKSIYFIVDAKSFYVTETVLVNAQGDINDISFSDLKVNTNRHPLRLDRPRRREDDRHLQDAEIAGAPPLPGRCLDPARRAFSFAQNV